jgi:hypothetical protein
MRQFEAKMISLHLYFMASVVSKAQPTVDREIEVNRTKPLKFPRKYPTRPLCCEGLLLPVNVCTDYGRVVFSE